MTESSDWLLDQLSVNAFENELGRSERIENFSKSFSPFLESYYSPLNPVFAFRGMTPTLLNKKKMWLLRDGAVPLAWFLANTPGEAVRSTILVHRDLAPWIPTNWKKLVRYYNHFSDRQFDSKHPPTRLLLAAPWSKGIMSVQELDHRLRQIVSELGKSRLKNIAIQLFLPKSQYDFTVRGDDSYDFQFMQTIFLHLGSQVCPVSRLELERQSFVGTAYVELNQNWLFCDSSFQHHFLSRGAGLLRIPDAPIKTGKMIRLSPFHGIQVSKHGATARRLRSDSAPLLAFSEKLQKSLRPHEEDANAPWPTWFEKWCRASIANPYERLGKIGT